MSQINDAILAATGANQINDGLALFYGQTADESLNDAEYRWLTEQGATPANVNDMWYQILGCTEHINDCLLRYWLDTTQTIPVWLPIPDVDEIQGSSWSIDLNDYTNGADPQTFTLDSGVLPNGITLNANGTFSGTILDASGSGNAKFESTNALGSAISASMNWSIIVA